MALKVEVEVEDERSSYSYMMHSDLSTISVRVMRIKIRNRRGDIGIKLGCGVVNKRYGQRRSSDGSGTASQHWHILRNEKLTRIVNLVSSCWACWHYLA
jgi:hypothetical protein